MYLYHPFTRETFSIGLLDLNAAALGLSSVSNAGNGKLHEFNGFITEYKQYGANYKIVLHSGAQSLECTAMGNVFRDDPCHFGMLLCCRDVTLYKEAHGIITDHNVVSIYCNYHSV
jgi:hypothetical protein